MKKAFTLLIVLLLVSLFSMLLLFMIETKSLQHSNYTKHYLHLQAKEHLKFLESIAQNIKEDATVQTLQLNQGAFEFTLYVQEAYIDIYVQCSLEPIRLHKRLIK